MSESVLLRARSLYKKSKNTLKGNNSFNVNTVISTRRVFSSDAEKKNVFQSEDSNFSWLIDSFKTGNKKPQQPSNSPSSSDNKADVKKILSLLTSKSLDKLDREKRMNQERSENDEEDDEEEEGNPYLLSEELNLESEDEKDFSDLEIERDVFEENVLNEHIENFGKLQPNLPKSERDALRFRNARDLLLVKESLKNRFQRRYPNQPEWMLNSRIDFILGRTYEESVPFNFKDLPKYYPSEKVEYNEKNLTKMSQMRTKKGFPSNITREELMWEFAKYGKVWDAKIFGPAGNGTFASVVMDPNVVAAFWAVGDNMIEHEFVYINGETGKRGHQIDDPNFSIPVNVITFKLDPEPSSHYDLLMGKLNFVKTAADSSLKSKIESRKLAHNNMLKERELVDFNEAVYSFVRAHYLDTKQDYESEKKIKLIDLFEPEEDMSKSEVEKLKKVYNMMDLWTTADVLCTWKFPEIYAYYTEKEVITEGPWKVALEQLKKHYDNICQFKFAKGQQTIEINEDDSAQPKKSKSKSNSNPEKKSLDVLVTEVDRKSYNQVEQNILVNLMDVLEKRLQSLHTKIVEFAKQNSTLKKNLVSHVDYLVGADFMKCFQYLKENFPEDKKIQNTIFNFQKELKESFFKNEFSIPADSNSALSINEDKLIPLSGVYKYATKASAIPALESFFRFQKSQEGELLKSFMIVNKINESQILKYYIDCVFDYKNVFPAFYNHLKTNLPNSVGLEELSVLLRQIEVEKKADREAESQAKSQSDVVPANQTKTELPQEFRIDTNQDPELFNRKAGMNYLNFKSKLIQFLNEEIAESKFKLELYYQVDHFQIEKVLREIKDTLRYNVNHPGYKRSLELEQEWRNVKYLLNIDYHEQQEIKSKKSKIQGYSKRIPSTNT